MNLLIRRDGYSVLCFILIALLLSLAVPVFSQAPEEVIPPCFTGSELDKVREWEKTWVGKKVGLANVDQVKDFLPDTLFQMMKEPKKWGADELWFETVPYQYCAPSKGMVEATKKYSPLSKFEPNGFKTPWGEVAPNELLAGYLDGKVAGYPFPRPKTGLEMAWNLDANTYGDNHQRAIFGSPVNCRTGAERHAWQPQTYLYWTGRVDVPPTPRIENNPKKIRRTLLMTLIDPPETYGTKVLELIYADPRKEEDMYVWTAMFRRIRRMTASQRGDTVDSADQAYSDSINYADQINRNTYKFLEVRDMLACRHQDGKKLTRATGQGFFNGQQRERCKLYLIEVVSKDKKYVYPKELWYLDGETWQMPYKQCWDRQGRVWRFLDSQLGYLMSIQGNPVVFTIAYNYVDVQALHGCPNNFKDPKFGMELKTDMFTVQNLQRSGY